MVTAKAPPVERRGIPGTDRAWSAVSIRVDPPRVAPPSADERTVALLRRARDRGVTTFDVAHSRHPERGERLIATAFPSEDPQLSVIVGRSVDSVVEGRTRPGKPFASEDLGALLEQSLEESRRRLAPVPVSVVEWRSSHGSAEEAALGSPLARLSDFAGPNVLWASELPPSAGTLPLTGRPTSLFAGELSLLDFDLLPLFESAAKETISGLIARNPFSNGRLDGTRFALGPLVRGPGAAPADLRQLHEDFDPVLRLRFLTDRRRRTLAQAAIRFALAWTWVTTVVIPLPDPERLEEILGYAASPPLSDDEFARLGLVK